jgi:hypothetical protein
MSIYPSPLMPHSAPNELTAIPQYRNVQYVSQIELYLAEGLRPETTLKEMFTHT